MLLAGAMMGLVVHAVLRDKEDVGPAGVMLAQAATMQLIARLGSMYKHRDSSSVIRWCRAGWRDQAVHKRRCMLGKVELMLKLPPRRRRNFESSSDLTIS